MHKVKEMKRERKRTKRSCFSCVNDILCLRPIIHEHFNFIVVAMLMSCPLFVPISMVHSLWFSWSIWWCLSWSDLWSLLFIFIRFITCISCWSYIPWGISAQTWQLCWSSCCKNFRDDEIKSFRCRFSLSSSCSLIYLFHIYFFPA